jgi:cytidylate kinase
MNGTPMSAPKARRSRWIVALDGPAGVGRLVARALGYRFFSTGEMYRVVGWRAIEEGVNLDDAADLERLSRRIRWDFRPSEDGVALRTFADGVEAAPFLSNERVGPASSKVAAVEGVRRHLVELQRGLGRRGGVVMEGRDVGTNVFPNAEFKFFLEASVRERARRRTLQLERQGEAADPSEIEKGIAERDLRDSGRKVNPLRKAADAVVIDTTRMTLDDVVECVLRSIRCRREGA